MHKIHPQALNSHSRQVFFFYCQLVTHCSRYPGGWRVEKAQVRCTRGIGVTVSADVKSGKITYRCEISCRGREKRCVEEKVKRREQRDTQEVDAAIYTCLCYRAHTLQFSLLPSFLHTNTSHPFVSPRLSFLSLVAPYVLPSSSVLMCLMCPLLVLFLLLLNSLSLATLPNSSNFSVHYCTQTA